MSGQRHSDRDLRRILDVVDAGRGAEPVSGGLPDAVLTRLAELVPCDLVSFTDFDVASSVAYFDQECSGDDVASRQSEAPEPDDPFFRHYWQTDCCSYPSRSGDDITVTKRSDFYTDLQWRGTPMFAECFADLGFTHELMCCLPTQHTRARRVIFFRSGSTDFDECDRLNLSLLRPHFTEMERRTQPTNDVQTRLTPRQRELMHLVAAGHTNSEIAKRLYLTNNTVRKHLENIFERLEVGTRTAAVARVFPD
jgi:DNA-binding CsgD family transcriptional regulator